MHDAERALFEGAFMVRGETYSILKTGTYEKVKAEGDPLVEVGRGNGLVVFRDRDVNKQKGKGGRGCSHDELEWNVSEEHPVRRQKAREVEMRRRWAGINVGREEDWVELGLGRRDDVAGGSTGTK